MYIRKTNENSKNRVGNKIKITSNYTDIDLEEPYFD